MENQNIEQKKGTDKFLSISILIAAVLIAGAFIYSAGLKETGKTDTQQKEQSAGALSAPEIGDDVILGDPNASVTIIIFGDYQCPFCAKFFKESELLIIKNYVESGKAKMVFKDLAFLGPESTAAAEAAECAKDQGKYWQYHNAIYEIEYAEVERVLKGELSSNEGNGNLNRNLFQKIASDLQMNVNDFLACFDSQKYAKEVEGDIEEAKAAIGERLATPTVFINGTMIQGAQPYDVFSEAIEEALIK